MRVIWPFGKGPGKVTGVSQMWMSFIWLIRCCFNFNGFWSQKLRCKDLDLHIVFVAYKLKNQFNSLRSEFQKKGAVFSRESPNKETFSAPNSLDWLDIWTMLFGGFFDVYFEILDAYTSWLKCRKLTRKLARAYLSYLLAWWRFIKSS